MRGFLAGVFCALVLNACASVVWNYRYYGMDLVSYDGKLLGKTASDDLPANLCAPDAQAKGKCVVMFIDEYQRLQTDFVKNQDQLKDVETQLSECQASHG